MNASQSSLNGLPEVGSKIKREVPVSKLIPFAHPILSCRKERFALRS